MANVDWKIHTPKLLDEVLNANHNMAIFAAPFNIFARTLAQVAERASELNDPQLNELMCRLTLYEIADPYSPEYNPEMLKEIQYAAQQARAGGRKASKRTRAK